VGTSPKCVTNAVSALLPWVSSLTLGTWVSRRQDDCRCMAWICGAVVIQGVAGVVGKRGPISLGTYGAVSTDLYTYICTVLVGKTMILRHGLILNPEQE
jgi:hypothetical protein